MQSPREQAPRHQERWQSTYQRYVFGQHLGELHDRIESLDRSHQAGARKIADKLDLCCRRPVIITYADPERYRIAESRCRSRVCPRCSRIRAKALSHRIAALIRQMDQPRFLTLTIRSKSGPLADQVKFLRRRFAAIRRRPEWHQHVISGVYTIEITWNKQSCQWHPHLHAIIDGSFWEQKSILGLWQAIVKDHAGVDIRAVTGVRKLANYLACYVAKSCDLSLLPPDQLVQWAIETHGLRLAQTFGSLQSCKPQSEPAEPMPQSLVDLDPRDIALYAEHGSVLALDLLCALNPSEHAPNRPSHHETGNLIRAMQRVLAPPSPPPRERKEVQLHLRSITSN